MALPTCFYVFTPHPPSGVITDLLPGDLPWFRLRTAPPGRTRLTRANPPPNDGPFVVSPQSWAPWWSGYRAVAGSFGSRCVLNVYF